MHKHRYIIFIAFLLFLFEVSGQTNRALVVAISEYPEGSGWGKLNSNNDLRILTPLFRNHKFPDKNIIILKEASATKKNISSAFKELSAKTRAGDYVYLHFSCHGQQMMDDNGDEEDGLDESLIPYDAGYLYEEGIYEGENHLRDDELGLWIDELRKKAGPNGNMLVMLDACHSGTGNRAKEGEFIRGTSAIFGPEDYKPVKGKNLHLSLHLIPKTGYSQAMVISACQDDQTNFEYPHQGTNYGFLTYSFTSTMGNVSQNLSVDEFMNKLAREMVLLRNANKQPHKQTPYMECTDGKAPFKFGR